MRQPITDIKAIRAFIFGGKAMFEIHSLTSGNKFCYKILKAKGGGIFFVYCPKGNGFEYIGFIREFTFYIRKADKDSIFNMPLVYLLAGIQQGRLHSKMQISHFGQCGVCGRTLTDPVSIERGIGPICAKERIYENY